MRKMERLIELDALRGLAALSVMLYHYTTRYNQLFGHVKANYFEFEYGNFGVQVFLIISGFVIFMTINKIKSVKEFALKRAVRLYPAYITSVILTFTLVSIFSLKGRETSLLEALFNLTMLQGFIPFDLIPHVDGAYWSLKVELTFYFFMGCIFSLKLINKIEIPLIIWLSFAFILRGISLFSDNFIINALMVYGILSYCHLFIAGIMFYMLRDTKKKSYYFIIFACLFYEFLYNGLFRGTVVLIFFSIFYMLISGKLGFIAKKPLIFLGTISYSLYLIHQNIGYIIINFMEKNGFVNEFYILIPILISIGLATAITFLIEKPLQNMIISKSKSRKNIDNQIVNL